MIIKKASPFYIGGEFDYNRKTYYNKNSKIGKKISLLEKNFSINGISSFYKILKELKLKNLKKIYIPSYICSHLILPIKKAKLHYEFYNIHNDFSSNFIPEKNTGLLLMHYFGKNNPSLEFYQKQSENNFYLIEDATHSYMNKNFDLLKKNFLFFSLRKHGSLGAGGWSNSRYLIDKSAVDENNFLEKNIQIRQEKFLMLQSNTYWKKEETFINHFKILNSIFSKKISLNIIKKKKLNLTFNYNWEFSIKKRIENWNTLNGIVKGKFKKYHDNVSDECVPLGYIIYLKNRDKIINKLKKKGIFTSVHWSLPKEINSKNFVLENKISNTILTIPIDQRYGKKEMEYIGETLYKVT